jgi:hypothetical protein
MSAPWDSALGLWGKAMENNYQTTSSKTTQKMLTQEGINKLIYDALSSDQGLAALSSGENLSGGFKSSSKTLLAQDMMTKLVGELANVTAKVQEDQVGEKNTKEGRDSENLGLGKSVICTELARQGLLSQELYRSVGGPHKQVSYFTWRGYHVWATKVVPLMQKSTLLSKALLPLVRSRYELLTHVPGLHILGRITQICEAPCWVIGCILAHVAHFSEMKNAQSGQSA